MASLNGNFFHQCPTFSANKGKVFVTGASCHVIISTTILVIRTGGYEEGECRRIVWRGKHYVSGNERWVDTCDICLWSQYICLPVRLAQLILCARNYGMRCSSVGIVTRLWVVQQETCAVNTNPYYSVQHNRVSFI